MRARALTIAVTLILAASAWASTESLLYSFNAFNGDGYYPYSGLIADANGNLYGTTYSGGAGLGTVFELKLSGGTYTEVQLHIFTGGTTDGEYPEYSSLVLDKAGNVYGTTAYGGSTSNAGTVFELTKSGGNWTEKLIHSFTGYPKDGYLPQAGLSFDSAGSLYGTTYQGGLHNVGTVFQMKPKNGKWTFQIIHSFAGPPGGDYPFGGGVTAGKNGYYYGTTYYGGPTFNAGTVYRLFQARGVWVSQTVYVFSGGASGTNPDSSLTMDANGNFFGTTYAGGDLNLGTVFELKAGKNNKYTYSVIYSFKGGTTDGSTPYYGQGPALDGSGNLFGTTRSGGANGAGIVYELKPSGGHYKEHVVWSFGGSGDANGPLAGVILVKGKLLGTTYAGGAHSAGTVFKITP
jgi:uncharacterized repeat protein (TIGR03803 family)